MSLRVRLALLYGSLLAVTLALFATLLYFTLLTNLSRQTDNQLRQRARSQVALTAPVSLVFLSADTTPTLPSRIKELLPVASRASLESVMRTISS